MFEKEKHWYLEDCKTHDRPWELWQCAIVANGELEWCDLVYPPQWADYCVYRRKPTTFVPEYYSGLNWRDAEHLIGKAVECSNCPDAGWYLGDLKMIAELHSDHFGVNIDGCDDFFTYLRTCKETFKHPTINIGGVCLPMPATVAPRDGEQYWLSHAGGDPGYILFWNNDDEDISALKECRVHLTKERAQAWADWWKSMVIDKMERN